MTCYSRTTWTGRAQEIYETASRDAGRRARELRAQGCTVTVAPLGVQLTSVGRIRLTLLTITAPDGQDIPHPAHEKRL